MGTVSLAELGPTWGWLRRPDNHHNRRAGAARCQSLIPPLKTWNPEGERELSDA